MKKQLLSVILGVSIAFSGTGVLAAEDAMMMKHEMNIIDVTGGKEIRSIVTSPDASGYASVYYNEEDGYNLHGVFTGLTDPDGDDFYEGWVVQKSPFKFISTGILTKKEDGKYYNDFSSSIDYSTYNFYVLTLEPNDGNDAPADHILEGDVMQATMIKHDDTMLKEDAMMKKEGTMMMKKLTPAQEVIKKGIKAKLTRIDTSKIDVSSVLTKIKKVRDGIDERGFSADKKTRYLELLDILENVFIEMSEMKMEMIDDTMMQK